jgi:hypothetical protein
MSEEIDIGLLKSFFEEHSNIELVYLFGSAKDGEVAEGSDLDIAVLFTEKPDISELAELRADMQSMLHFEDIDIVMLNRASPYLRFEALQGKRIFSRNRSREAGFASLAAREYEDENAMLHKALRY